MAEIRDDALAVTTALQQSMVYQSLRARHAGVYLQQLTIRFHEALDVAKFRAAWQRLIARHEALRTTFHLDGDVGLVQWVHTDTSPAWMEESWEGLSSEEQEARWRALLVDDRRLGFDLAEMPPLRFSTIRLGPAEHLFLWTYHHALLDGRSQRLLLEEVFACYDAGSGATIVAPVAPFRDLLDWLETRDVQGSKHFWRDFLQGFSAPTPLPVSTQMSPAGGSDGGDRAIHEAVLSEEETSALRAFAATHDLTLGTLLQAAWAALLGRYGGGDDVVFGATRACRHTPVPGVASMIGLLINTVPMRVRLDPDRPVLEWLREVRAAWVSIRPHEHSALNLIHEWSRIERGSPLFESMLIIEDRSHSDVAITPDGDRAHREIKLLERGNEILVGLAYGGKRLHLKVSGDPSRIDDALLGRMLRHWRTLLLGLPGDLARRVADLPILDERERADLLRAATGSVDAQAATVCLHQLFEARASREPDRIALYVEAESISYGELDARANQLARHLQMMGVGPEVRVAICLGRSAPLLVAVLAVLKAGGAYVPLNPDDPPARRGSMLAESGALILIGSRASWAASIAPEVLRVDPEADATTIAAESRERPRCLAGPHNLAYALYTSGSTGHPKLVGVEHRSIVNLIRFATGTFLGPRELGLSPFSISICFDPSLTQMFCPWAVGGSVVLLESLAALPRSVHAGSFTVVGATPSVLAVILEDFELPDSVRVVILGAEAPSDALLDRLARYPSLEKVMNVYGPTEATGYCSISTLFERRATAVTEPRSALGEMLSLVRTAGARNIGRPIANTQIYILDARGRPVPIGVSGEIHVGGGGVARGYLNRADLTAERFVSDPFSNAVNARMYKTGDLGRWRADGSIEFLGRSDFQVKVRGFRVELGEIEARLMACPGVREAVVLAREDRPGDKRLVAYVTAEPGSELSAAQLRRAVSGMLPDYMIPSAFVQMQALPLTPNGKLDRKGLPLPDAAAFMARDYEAPEGETEQRLARIWAELLQVERVGPEHNFFELGGHSLTALRLVARVGRVFGVQIGVAALFAAPTLRQLARRVSESEKPPEPWKLIQLQPLGEKTPIIAINNGMLYYKLSQKIGTDRRFLAVQLFDPINPKPLPYRSLEQIAADYVELIRAAQPHGPYILMGLCIAGLIAYEAARQLRLAGERVPLVIMADTWSPTYDVRVPFPHAILFSLRRRLNIHRHTLASFRALRFDEFVATTRFAKWNRLIRTLVALGLIKNLEEFTALTNQDIWFLLDLMRARAEYQPPVATGDVVLLESNDLPISRWSDQNMGWGDLVTGRLLHCRLQAWHDTLFRDERSIGRIAAILRPLFDQVDTSEGIGHTAQSADRKDPLQSSSQQGPARAGQPTCTPQLSARQSTSLGRGTVGGSSAIADADGA
jgi:amino acid adenylation domain-containing protein